MRCLILALIAAMALGAASTAGASDADGAYSDYSADCSGLNKGLDNPGTSAMAKRYFHHFIAGFVSGFNLGNPDTWDVVGANEDLPDLVEDAVAYCRENPDESWSAAAQSAIRPRLATRARAPRALKEANQ